MPMISRSGVVAILVGLAAITGAGRAHAEPEPPVEPAPRPPFRLRLDGGYSARRVAELRTRGASIGADLALPKLASRIGLTLPLRVSYGRSQHGLAVGAVMIGFGFELELGHVHLEVAVPTIALNGVGRAIHPAWIVDTSIFGALAAARVDVFGAETNRVYLFGALDGATAKTGSDAWGWTAGAGVDFTIRRR
jgi:hypothetical protein